MSMDELIGKAVARNPGQALFNQAVEEVLETLESS